jgi:hypothetical protein
VFVTTLLLLVAAGLACVAYGVLLERRWYRVVRRRIDILPAAGPPSLTILHLSDLHFLRGDPSKSRFLASLPPADVTVVTGDFLAEPEAVSTAVESVRPVRGRLASWFVLGSNDYFQPRWLNPMRYLLPRRRRRIGVRGPWRQLEAALEADGWRHLRNVRSEVSLDGLPVELLGLDDAHLGWHDLRVALRFSPERFGVVVAHSPDPAPELAALGYDLVIAGHTHGGQVRMPFLGALVTNSHLPRRLVSGLFRLPPSWVHVSPGLGTGKYAPFRFLCRPEATFLELRRQPATARSNTAS